MKNANEAINATPKTSPTIAGSKLPLLNALICLYDDLSFGGPLCEKKQKGFASNGNYQTIRNETNHHNLEQRM
jgi:hypothetical protein